MRPFRPFLPVLLCLAFAAAARADESDRISLNGEWAFAADYLDLGEKNQWPSPAYKDAVWDKVTTPHVWSLDPRFPYFIGAGWYRKRITPPSAWKGRCVRLVFEAVNASAKVWLNGKLIAEHEGGYTPFEADVSRDLDYSRENTLVVRADNRWKESWGGDPQQQVRGWMEDGGILRDAFLMATPQTYIARQKIEAVPDLATGEAAVRVVTWIRNAGAEETDVRVASTLRCGREPAGLDLPEARAKAAPGATVPVEIRLTLPKERVRLWTLESPVLYRMRTQIVETGAAAEQTFGIRRFEVRGSALLLNGEPVRLAGANRIANGVDFGQNDPPEMVERDLRLMKDAGLVFMRMHHLPLSPAALDWADRNGMLLIEECFVPSSGNPNDLDSESDRDAYRAQSRAMIERDWNRPCIVAWSVGNEIASETPAGLRWVRDMKEHVRGIDPSRLVCFASNRAGKPNVRPEEEASSLTDFVCLNTYGATPAENAANIDRAHGRWSDKPFVITEFGLRADRVASEDDRVAWFAEMIRLIRERPFISGVSFWTFNDYRSRYVGSNPIDGCRWWGLVDFKRAPRASYALVRREFAPVQVKEARVDGRTVLVTLVSRADFPVFPPADCEARLEFFDGRAQPVGQPGREKASLTPGAEIVLRFPMPERASFFRGELRRGEAVLTAFGPNAWGPPPGSVKSSDPSKP